VTGVRTLETVLADYRSDADALDRTQSTSSAKLLRQICDEVEKSAEDFLVFLPEKEAALWSGYAKDWLRKRFPSWARLGHAKHREHGKKDRLYRRCILPRRADLAAARADAVQTARAENA
jgi:hypothetical protein